ncbi:4,5-DOPA dioxygenase extradiol [Polynucleobacter sp. UK-Mo-2m-Kol15]|uniref:4,5-DOPA-extradiol-dioxygenase n=1 Tax=Polynucleobacter sp. UK-Mo-2m-Kol15 TaxID=2576916 RepID=UPI001C0B8B73|nr:4,5-DOPA dioxygenase extradiol [Polynucleobacter sp. UK-Mo-2m-Kol15]MBU3575086.1 4,5-DOPA dioxygenase extradiol [Polynucleobacter sp. UK-Mo-2m-Kol15]
MTSHRQPAVFAGHGSPMYAIEPNRYTASWATLGKSLKRPDAILVISAHWVTRGVWVTAMPKPKTIHDFGGFPQALYDIQYPAPGSPALADRVKALLGIPVVLEENEWGIDHGAWSVLRYLYPDADIPVVQLSLDGSLSAREHFELAAKLRPLRDENILILASGNVVHNLRTIHWDEDATPYPWAKKFNDFFISEMKASHHQTLIDWEQLGDAAHLSIPTPEHYWPALYVLGLQEQGETPKVLVDGIEMSSISMLTFSIQ